VQNVVKNAQNYASNATKQATWSTPTASNCHPDKLWYTHEQERRPKLANNV